VEKILLLLGISPGNNDPVVVTKTMTTYKG